MKKTLAAITAGVMLVAGQAAAANGSATLRVADRVGAPAEASNEFAGVPMVPLLAVAAIIALGVIDAADDDSDSD